MFGIKKMREDIEGLIGKLDKRLCAVEKTAPCDTLVTCTSCGGLFMKGNLAKTTPWLKDFGYLVAPQSHICKTCIQKPEHDRRKAKRKGKGK